MTYDVEIGGHQASVRVRPHPDGGYWVAVGEGAERHVQVEARGDAEWFLAEQGRGRRVALSVRGDRLDLQLADGTGLSGTVVDPRDRALAALAGSGKGAVSTPMPGQVVRVLVAEGDSVDQGQVLVVVEAMKMENEFKAPRAGTVSTVHVASGASLEAGALLVTLAESE